MDVRESRTDGRPGGVPGVTPRGGAESGHRLTLRAREEAEISGVLHVASFDDREIVLETQLGTLTLHGHELQIKQLDLNEGTFRVEGMIDSVGYSTPGQRRGQAHSAGGLLTRIFR
jgi:sporulation protein YabP